MPSQQDQRDTRWFLQRMPSDETLRDVLQGDPVPRLLGIAADRAIANAGLDVVPKPGADEQAVTAMLNLAAATAKRLAKEGESAVLTADEQAALDLFILLVARPAIFVQDGRVPGRPENWSEVARDEQLLPRVIAGVGRVETADHDKLGTAFILGDRRLLTNNHVLCALVGMETLDAWKLQPMEFAAKCESQSQAWTADPATAPIFDLRGELGSAASAPARVTRVVAHHSKVDMAVLEIDKIPEGGRPLRVAAAEPASFVGRRIYAVGYPVDDARNIWGQRTTPAPVFRRVFGADDESLGTKRFSPGLVIGWRDDETFQHDASTLPGSSGSCIVDFEERRVIGLHFGGLYKMQSNWAVPLWKFQNDPVLASSGARFV